MRRSLLLAVIAVTAAACTRGPALETRTFQLQYLNVETAAEMIRPYVFFDRENAPGVLSVADNLLTVRETPDNLERIRRVLAQYDGPRPSVRLHFQVIRANGAQGADPAIADVEAELRKLFRFQGYRLVATAVTAGIEGSRLSQAVAQDMSIITAIRRVRGAGDSATVELEVQLRVLSGMGGELQTSVTVPVGKTVVLGNAQTGSPRGHLILTVRPELVDN